MTEFNLVLTHWFGVVPLTMVYGFLMTFYLSGKVMKARKEYKIEYPNLYADRTIDGEEKANKFNCI